MKIKLNKNVVSAIVSLASAIICAIFAGCQFSVGKLAMEDLAISLVPTNTITSANN